MSELSQDAAAQLAVVRRNYHIGVSPDGKVVHFLPKARGGKWLDVRDLNELREHRQYMADICAELVSSSSVLTLPEVPVEFFPSDRAAVTYPGGQWGWEADGRRVGEGGDGVIKVSLRRRDLAVTAMSQRYVTQRSLWERVLGTIGGDEFIFGPVAGDPIAIIVQCQGVVARKLLLVVRTRTVPIVVGFTMSRHSVHDPLKYGPYRGAYAEGSLIVTEDSDGTTRVFEQPNL